MVISQIAGLATAFGTGELSGAGFGPNYTILMKLGYEFFAPRILEEMEKNPNVFFQDTLWFQKFQKQIKLYSDTVMHETLETLLNIPQATIDAIQTKFASPEGIVPPNVPLTASPAFNNILNIFKILDNIGKGLKDFNLIPQAFAERPIVPTTPDIISEKQGLSLDLFQLGKWSFTNLNDAMSAITKGNSPYDKKTQDSIRKLWKRGRQDVDSTKEQHREELEKVFEPVKPKIVKSKRRMNQSVKLELAKLSQELLRKVKEEKLIFNAFQKILQHRGRTFKGTIKLGIDLRNIRLRIKQINAKLQFIYANYIV